MKKIFAVAAAIVAAMAVTACSSSSFSSASDFVSRGMSVQCENSDDGSGSGTVIVEEGECVVFTPDLSKGNMHVAFYPEEGSDVVLYETDCTGTESTFATATPGEYSVVVTASDKATGSLTIAPADEAEVVGAQNQAADEIVDQAS